MKPKSLTGKEKPRMNRTSSRLFTSLAVLAVVLAMTTPAVAQTGGSAAAVSKSPNGVYIVQMVDAPVVAYEGGIKGLKATKPRAGQKIDPNSPAVVNYVAHLDARRCTTTDTASTASRRD
jgi:hypothetical protein